MSTVEFTPQALRSAKFREKLKGYHPEDVDAFLERAATAMDQLSERLSDATARAMKAEGALAGNSEADENVRRTLVRAQRTAEMAVREANEDARRARVQAQGEADAIVATARDEACRLRADAEDAAARLDEQAERVSAMAREQATMTISSADAAAAETVRTAEERSARLGHESSTRIEAERAEAHAEHAEAQAGLRRWCDEAAQRADAAVRSAERQHEQLRADVATLAGYLANERARVLDVLTEATEHFSDSLTLRPPPLSDELVGRPTALPVASRPENATPLGYETDSDETAGGETAGGETGSGVLVGTAQVTADQREPVVDMIGHEQPMDHQSGKDHQSDEDHPPVGDDTVADHQLIEHRVGADQLLDQPTDGRPDDQWADDQWVEEASEDMAAPCDVSACSDPVGARSVLPAAVGPVSTDGKQDHEGSDEGPVEAVDDSGAVDDVPVVAEIAPNAWRSTSPPPPPPAFGASAPRLTEGDEPPSALAVLNGDEPPPTLLLALDNDARQPAPVPSGTEPDRRHRKPLLGKRRA